MPRALNMPPESLHDRRTCPTCGAWAAYIDALPAKQNAQPWRVFATYTFAASLPEETAVKLFRAYLNHLADRLGAHVLAAFSVELQERGAAHVHALLTTFDLCSFNPCVVQEVWTHGNRAAAAFNPERDGARYVSKEHRVDARIGCPQSHPCHGGRRCKFVKRVRP